MEKNMNQWGKKNVIEFYTNNRNKLTDLYKSEKIPLRALDKKKISKILDYGCAVGGFYEIFKKLINNKIVYHGVDSEKNIINVAKKKYENNSKVKFNVISQNKKKITTKKYSLTFCTGVLNHNKNYKTIIEGLIKCSSHYIFIDSPRVHFGKSFIGKLNLTKRFPSDIRKDNIVNNLTINLKEYLIFLKKIFKKNKIQNAVFYSDYLPYKKKYLNINKKISFLTFCCSKKRNSNNKFLLICKNKETQNTFKKIFN